MREGREGEREKKVCSGRNKRESEKEKEDKNGEYMKVPLLGTNNCCRERHDEREYGAEFFFVVREGEVSKRRRRRKKKIIKERRR